MINETKYIDTAYETLYILNHCDKEFITKIPIKILNNLKEIAKNSSKKFNLLPNKKLKEQNISDETKDFISGLYYTYIADKNEKKEILSKTINLNYKQITHHNNQILFHTIKKQYLIK